MAKTPAWQRAAGKNPEGGLNEKGRASLRAAGHDIKRPQPEGGARKKSFCARMEGAKAKLTSSETANDPDSRINKSLRKWKCADGGSVDPYDSVQQAAKGGPIWDKPRPKKLGKPEPLSSKEKASAKASAKAAGRPYPNLVDNMRAARADGGEVDDRAHEFVQEQLKSGEPQVSQYNPEAGMETAKEAGRMLAGVTTPGAIADAAGYLGGPSALQNAREGNYGTAALQLAGAVPGVGPFAKAARIAEEAKGAEDVYRAVQQAAQSPIKAYHYSPQAFDRFETGHAGTGASGTSFGHGLYFGSKEDDARMWQQRINQERGLPKESGHMYEAELALDPSKMIDYNKFLHEQPEFVRDALINKLGYEPKMFEAPAEGSFGGGKPRGDMAVPQSEGAMKAWRDAGIHGVQYYDPSNSYRGYVAFSGEPVSILRRYADGGQVEGDVQFAPDDPYANVQEAAKLPMMAQNDFAMRMPQPEVRYDTGPQPGEAELRSYDPTIKERIYQGIAGTEERPSPERAQFARGISQMAEFAPVLGNVMAGQEAQRRGDTKGMLMAALPVPGMATESRMAEAAISPAQEAAKEAYQRVLNAQGLYSHAAEAAANLPQAKGSYEQMMAMLKTAGVKPEEMRWSGVEQFAGQPVTREQLVSHFEQNAPKIEETYLSDVGRPHQFGTPEEQEAALNRYHSAKDKFWKAQYGSPEYDELANEFRSAESALKDIVPGWGRAEGKTTEPTKFSGYTIPGGENYREVLLHTPERMGESKYRVHFPNGRSVILDKEHQANALAEMYPGSRVEERPQTSEANYRSSHWDQPNVLGHLRMSDRTGPEGEKILHLEELQSDWGQAGRKQGFRGEPIQYGSKIEGYIPQGYSWKKTIKPNVSHVIHQLVDRSGNIVGEASTKIDALRKSGLNPTIPSAPYVESTKNWVDLGLKRALKEAAEGGYGKMVWTPGEQQAARYDLSQQIGSITARPTQDGKIHLEALTPDMGSVVHNGVHNPNDIDDIIGKELADKIRSQIQFPEIESGYVVRNKRSGNQSNVFKTREDAEDMLKNYPESLRKDLIIAEGNRTTHGKAAELSGLDLKVGGEGMKSFYDKMVPTRLKELLKKIDPQAKMSMTEINGEDGPIKVPTVEITPKIREAVKKGLPLYAKGGEVVNNADPYDNIQLAAKISPRARRASK